MCILHVEMSYYKDVFPSTETSGAPKAPFSHAAPYHRFIADVHYYVLGSKNKSKGAIDDHCSR